MITIRTKNDYLVILEGTKYEEREIACADSAVKLMFDTGMKCRVFFDKEQEAWTLEMLYNGREDYELSLDEEQPDVLCMIDVNGDIVSHEVEEI